MMKVLTFLIIFIVGELLFNLTWYRYLKDWFNFTDGAQSDESSETKIEKKFIFLGLSTFKGILERFLLAIGLVQGYTPIMVVFGTIKLGTRFKENQEVKNDYFLLGNFSSLLIAILYSYLFALLSSSL